MCVCVCVCVCVSVCLSVCLSVYACTHIHIYIESSRRYVSKMLAVSPVLVHFGLLVYVFNYLFAVIAMEIFSAPLPPHITPSELDAYRRQSCQAALPQFNCFVESSLSIFRVFIENNWGDVLHAGKSDMSVLQNAAVDLFFFMAYMVDTHDDVHTSYMHIYIYICVCVCVCVCMYI